MKKNAADLSQTDALIRFARVYAAERLPWFAPALFSTKIHLTEKVPVAAIDNHLNSYWNPEKIENIRANSDQLKALQQIGFLWIHEISHILREHASRAAELHADPEIWNIAADMEINDSHWEGLEAPELYPGFYPKTMKLKPGQLAEYYYRKLTEEEEKDTADNPGKFSEQFPQQKEQSEKPQEINQPKDAEPNEDKSEAPQNDSKEDQSEKSDQSEENAGESSGDDHNGQQDQDQSEPEGPAGESTTEETSVAQDNSTQESSEDGFSGDPSEEAEPAANPSNSQKPSWRDQFREQMDEGSGVHQVPRDWEITTEQDHQEMDEIEIERVRVAVASEMEEALKAGLIPGGWERWIGKKLRPVKDWRKILRHRVSRAINHSVGARIDYSFNRPSRRQSVYDPILPPALTGSISGQIACVLDTSGSISDQRLAQIMTEVSGIFAVFNTPVTLIPCDAKAYAPIKLSSQTDIRQVLNIPGGGGTNMIRGIEAALTLTPVPDVVVVLTDGYTPYPVRLYKTPVIFGILMTDLNETRMLPGPPWRDDLVVKIGVRE